ncbi:hypothetical protein [Leptolyngbya sp. 7M]|uniref:hypothetical protein n=1 Tax=Leptolyngbya sp. 7M TaxID=2812896 RepID=UPI001B8B780B|nr:hypothetical protein [Leptolyngbya sp. 7M]QYO65504.1 hypothetical protein JVX88_01570 [Leptolyngbya sp. 7M]
MKSWEEHGSLVIQETPAIVWFLGGFFIVIGALFVYGALGGFHNVSEMAAWERVLAFIFGSVGAVAGLWLLWGSPITTVRIDRQRGELIITRRRLWSSQQKTDSIADVQEFFVTEDSDSEGDPIMFGRFRSRTFAAWLTNISGLMIWCWL